MFFPQIQQILNRLDAFEARFDAFEAKFDARLGAVGERLGAVEAVYVYKLLFLFFLVLNPQRAADLVPVKINYMSPISRNGSYYFW